MRLIDADLILNDNNQFYYYLADEWVVRVRDIEQAETVDAAPVVHGHWENVEPAIWAGDYATCSVCRKRQTLEKVRNFCPNCGAQMEGRGENGGAV